MFERGASIEFTAHRLSVYRGKRYKEGDKLTIILRQDWDPSEGIGEGGPWGWGGYTTRFLKYLEAEP